MKYIMQQKFRVKWLEKLLDIKLYNKESVRNFSYQMHSDFCLVFLFHTCRFTTFNNKLCIIKWKYNVFKIMIEIALEKYFGVNAKCRLTLQSFDLTQNVKSFYNLGSLQFVAWTKFYLMQIDFTYCVNSPLTQTVKTLHFTICSSTHPFLF